MGPPPPQVIAAALDTYLLPTRSAGATAYPLGNLCRALRTYNSMRVSSMFCAVPFPARALLPPAFLGHLHAPARTHGPCGGLPRQRLPGGRPSGHAVVQPSVPPPVACAGGGRCPAGGGPGHRGAWAAAAAIEPTGAEGVHH